MEEAKKGRFSAGPLTVAVHHEIASVLPAMKKQALDMWEEGAAAGADSEPRGR